MTAQLASLGADFTGTTGGDPAWLITGELPARRVREAELRCRVSRAGRRCGRPGSPEDRPLEPSH
ncbi:hypothetical protein LV779_07100 [Streptomyces thinghirensis]|nr:hypothetical protein [Streptomyces thinghirensis]